MTCEFFYDFFSISKQFIHQSTQSLAATLSSELISEKNTIFAKGAIKFPRIIEPGIFSSLCKIELSWCFFSIQWKRKVRALHSYISQSNQLFFIRYNFYKLIISIIDYFSYRTSARRAYFYRNVFTWIIFIFSFSFLMTFNNPLVL